MYNNKIAVSFLLPSVSFVPGGGFKIIYEYANRLNKNQFKVNLIHPFYIKKPKRLINSIKFNLNFYKLKLEKKYYTGAWFPIEKGIKNYLIPFVADKYIPDADVIIATGWQTAEPVLNLKSSNGEKFYFIQSLETWAGPENEVINTWKFPLNKIVISKWLYEFALLMGQYAEYIPNGLDYSKFDMDILPENRNPKSILLMVNCNKVKGSSYGISAVSKLKEIVPDIEVTTFGIDNFYEQLPKWIKHFKNPPQKLLKHLYNINSIFFSPSLLEGFPLPPAEAMMCGSALVASDIGGHREYAVNGRNSLLYPPTDIEKGVECLLKLLRNNDMRCNLALNAYNDIKRYEWDKSVNIFEQFIKNNIKIKNRF